MDVITYTFSKRGPRWQIKNIHYYMAPQTALCNYIFSRDKNKHKEIVTRKKALSIMPNYRDDYPYLILKSSHNNLCEDQAPDYRCTMFKWVAQLD